MAKWSRSTVAMVTTLLSEDRQQFDNASARQHRTQLFVVFWLWKMSVNRFRYCKVQKPVHFGDRPIACCDCQKSFSRSYRRDMVDCKWETCHLPPNAMARCLLFGPLWRDTSYDCYVCSDYGKAFLLPFSLHNKVAMKMTVAVQAVL